MQPSFNPGDHVLTFNWATPKLGDVVVFKLGKDLFIKRITKFENGEIKVDGDNKSVSSKFRPIKFSQIIGKVILKY